MDGRGELVGDALGEVSPHPAGLAPEHETVSGVGSAETRGLGICTRIGPAAEYRLLQGMGINVGEAASFGQGSESESSV